MQGRPRRNRPVRHRVSRREPATYSRPSFFNELGKARVVLERVGGRVRSEVDEVRRILSERLVQVLERPVHGGPR